MHVRERVGNDSAQHFEDPVIARQLIFGELAARAEGILVVE